MLRTRESVSYRNAGQGFLVQMDVGKVALWDWLGIGAVWVLEGTIREECWSNSWLLTVPPKSQTMLVPFYYLLPRGPHRIGRRNKEVFGLLIPRRHALLLFWSCEMLHEQINTWKESAAKANVRPGSPAGWLGRALCFLPLITEVLQWLILHLPRQRSMTRCALSGADRVAAFPICCATWGSWDWGATLEICTEIGI